MPSAAAKRQHQNLVAAGGCCGESPNKRGGRGEIGGAQNAAAACWRIGVTCEEKKHRVNGGGEN